MMIDGKPRAYTNVQKVIVGKDEAIDLVVAVFLVM
jgi:hypothetical protein